MSVRKSPIIHAECSGETHASPISELIPVVLIITSMILVSVFGNLLVIMAYFKDRYLQTTYNLYIFNLALTDMLLGVFSMPFYLIAYANGWSWPLGRALCKVNLFVDFSLCTVTILLMILISWDRLCLVNSGASYYMKETKKRACAKIAAVWGFAGALYGPAIIGWDYFAGKTILKERECDAEFKSNLEFTLATAIARFFLPCISIVWINTLIYCKIRKLYNKTAFDMRKPSFPSHVSTLAVFPSVTRSSSDSVDGTNHSCGSHLDNVDMQYNGRSDSVDGNNHSSGSHLDSVDLQHNGNSVSVDEKKHSSRSHTGSICLHYSSSFGNGTSGGISGSRSFSVGQVSPVSVYGGKRLRKAATALSLLVVVFVICWFPYIIITCVRAFSYNCFYDKVYRFFILLPWLKSCINPLLYAYSSNRFRKNMSELLRVGKTIKYIINNFTKM